MGLRQRVILIITIPALLAIGVHGVLRVRQQQTQLLAAETKNLTLTAKAVQIAVENALRARQWTDVHHLVSQMVEEQDAIDRIRLFDRDGGLVFVSNPLKLEAPVSAETLQRVIASGRSEEIYDNAPGKPGVISILVPVRGTSKRIDGAMEIARLTAEMDRRLAAAIQDVLIRLGLVLCVTIGATAFVLQRQVLRPLERLAEGIQRLGRGESGVALAVDRGDELGEVAQQFNEMVQRLQDARRHLLAETERAFALEQQARQAGSLAVAGKLAVALAHEVGTPLNIISARAEFMLRGLPADAPDRADLDAIVGQIDRISRIITSLLDAVRPQAPKLEPTLAAQVLGDLSPLLDLAARHRGIALAQVVDDPLPLVRADAGQLQQVLINLVVNALEATPHGGEVRIAARGVARDRRPGVAIAVSDTGSGIAPELQAKIFESFFTTKPRGQGTGLGLAISRDIARAHGGELEVVSTPGAGATFTLWLPAEQPPP
jgi:signal transduction histidine kinase